MNRAILLAALAIFAILPRIAFALMDSTREFASSVKGWALEAQQADTGEVRWCTATGTFDGVEIGIVMSLPGNPMNGGMESAITMSYSRPHDGHDLTEKKATAKLLLNGRNAAWAEMEYKADLAVGDPVIHGFTATFKNMGWLKDALPQTNTLTITADQKEFKPVELSGLDLKNVMEGLQQCLKASP